VRYKHVRADGTVLCNFGNQCDLIGSGDATSNMSFSTQGTATSPHLPIATHSAGNAVAIEVQIRNSTNHPNLNCRGNGFSNNCRWFYTGNGMISTSVAPTAAQILAAPIQRAFRGDTQKSGSVEWLRLSQDTTTPCGSADRVDDNAASAQGGADRCFRMDMGLKGGIARSASEPAILFTDGIASNQLGAVACEPGGQGQILIDGVINGCKPWYGRHPFDWTPACPDPNSLFATPNPGSPWDDGRWPPLRCIDTRQTSQANQFERGFKGRFFLNQNTNQCPPTGPDYVRGRNYWDMDTPNGYVPNPPTKPVLGYKEGTHDTYFDEGDPRVVTIFQVTSDAFTQAPNKTYPIAGFLQIYVTGFGKISGNGSLQIDDPCPGNTPPPDLDTSGGNSGGFAVWGHIIDYVIPQPGATPSGRICNPGTTGQPCVAVLVD
jgi:hypothetical protein